MSKPYTTHEAWLSAGIEELRPLFKAKSAPLPADIIALTSWPHQSSIAHGQCFSPAWSKDKKSFYIIISPTVEKSVKVLDILVHELVHAARPDAKHGPQFKELAAALGQTGKMTSSHAGPALLVELEAINDRLGPYPHVAMHNHGGKKKDLAAKKTTVRCVSPVDPGYSVWLSPKQFAEHGAPLCPISKQPMEEV